MVGALEVPDHRISTTELLSDKKLTLLDVQSGPHTYAATTIGKSSLYSIDWETCEASQEPENQ